MVCLVAFDGHGTPVGQGLNEQGVEQVFMAVCSRVGP